MKQEYTFDTLRFTQIGVTPPGNVPQFEVWHDTSTGYPVGNVRILDNNQVAYVPVIGMFDDEPGAFYVEALALPALEDLLSFFIVVAGEFPEVKLEIEKCHP
jgi:hypothetical protein